MSNALNTGDLRNIHVIFIFLKTYKYTLSDEIIFFLSLVWAEHNSPDRVQTTTYKTTWEFSI
jgi:hypothetical protein